MELSLGFDDEKKNWKVFRLRKVLYGLNQSPKAWFDRFTKTVLHVGSKQAHADHTLFYHRKGYKVTILIVYVDDIILTENDQIEMESIKRN